MRGVCANTCAHCAHRAHHLPSIQTFPAYSLIMLAKSVHPDSVLPKDPFFFMLPLQAVHILLQILWEMRSDQCLDICLLRSGTLSSCIFLLLMCQRATKRKMKLVIAGQCRVLPICSLDFLFNKFLAGHVSPPLLLCTTRGST